MSDSPDREVEVFTEALQLAEGERAAYLEGACGGDVRLRQRVEALLQDHEAVGDFLEHSPHEPMVPSQTGLPGPVFSPEHGGDLGESRIAWIMARVSLDEAAKLMQTSATMENSVNHK
jgi:hypothetical protein